MYSTRIYGGVASSSFLMLLVVIVTCDSRPKASTFVLTKEYLSSLLALTSVELGKLIKWAWETTADAPVGEAIVTASFDPSFCPSLAPWEAPVVSPVKIESDQ